MLIMRFGIALIERISYARKFLLISMVFAVPIAMTTGLLVASLAEQYEVADLERDGIAYTASIRPLLNLIAERRALHQAALRGEAQAAGPLAATTQSVDDALKTLAASHRRLGAHLNTADLASKVNATWEAIRDGARITGAEDGFAQHSALVSQLQELLVHVADVSHLTLDPDLESNYLIDTLVFRLPVLAENISQSREFAMRSLIAGYVETDVRVELLLRLDRIDQGARALETNITVASAANPRVGERLASLTQRVGEAVREFNTTIRTGLLETGYAEITADVLTDSSTKAVKEVFALFDAELPLLDELLSARAAALRSTLIGISTAIAVSLALAIYLFVSFYLSNKRSLSGLTSATELIAQGDLNARVTMTARDETARVGEYFNRMADQVADLVSGVVRSIDGVSTAVGKLSGITAETAEGVERQKMATEEVAAAINEMSATVQEVARNTAAAAEATSHADAEAARGAENVDRVRQSIETLAKEIDNASGVVRTLKQYSDDIGTILIVIRNVADQTNLLALNAAIEAARAGDQGRGFAVVADEVRTLASRTQQSTKEIEVMIERLQSGSESAVLAMGESLERTRDCVELTRHATESLAGITKAVGSVNDLNTVIASSAEEQSAVAEGINHSIEMISEIAQRTSSGVKRTEEASTDLARLSAELKTRAGHFRT